MDKFLDVTETSFGWSAQDQKTKLLFPEVTESIRARATRETAPSGKSKCKACGSLISKGTSRSVFHWLSSFGWTGPNFVHAKAEDCTNVEIWDAHQTAQYHAAQVRH